MVTGCQFGVVNVSTSKKLVDMTRQTTSPITYVPLLILYVNGRPYMKYDGEKSDTAIRNFIVDVSKTIYVNGFTKSMRERGIPSYTVGHPLFGESEVCYLEFDPANGYHKTN